MPQCPSLPPGPCPRGEHHPPPPSITAMPQVPAKILPVSFHPTHPQPRPHTPGPHCSQDPAVHETAEKALDGDAEAVGSIPASATNLRCDLKPIPL